MKDTFCCKGIVRVLTQRNFGVVSREHFVLLCSFTPIPLPSYLKQFRGGLNLNMFGGLLVIKISDDLACKFGGVKKWEPLNKRGPQNVDQMNPWGPEAVAPITRGREFTP